MTWSSAPPRLQLCAHILCAPRTGSSPRQPIMATSSLRPGPVRASAGTIRGLYSFVPGRQQTAALSSIFNASTTICLLISNGISCGYETILSTLL